MTKRKPTSSSLRFSQRCSTKRKPTSSQRISDLRCSIRHPRSDRARSSGRGTAVGRSTERIRVGLATLRFPSYPVRCSPLAVRRTPFAVRRSAVVNSLRRRSTRREPRRTRRARAVRSSSPIRSGAGRTRLSLVPARSAADDGVLRSIARRGVASRGTAESGPTTSPPSIRDPSGASRSVRRRRPCGCDSSRRRQRCGRRRRGFASSRRRSRSIRNHIHLQNSVLI